MLGSNRMGLMFRTIEVGLELETKLGLGGGGGSLGWWWGRPGALGIRNGP